MKIIRVKIWPLLVICLLAWSGLLQAGTLSRSDNGVLGRWFEASIDGGVEYFRWQEFDSRGRRLLTEQGPRYVLEAFLGNRLRQGRLPLYGIKLRGYAGDVDYDGQDSNGIFTSSDTTYRGWGAELQGGYRFPVTATFSLDALLAAGVDDWRRDIDNSINANGGAVGGFTEDYTVYYGRLGLGALWSAGWADHYLQAGAKRPWSISEDPGALNITLSPGEAWSAFVSYEVRFRRLGLGRPFVRFYYDSYRFRKSSSERVSLAPPFGSGFVNQPETDLDVLGFGLGYSF